MCIGLEVFRQFIAPEIDGICSVQWNLLVTEEIADASGSDTEEGRAEKSRPEPKDQIDGCARNMSWRKELEATTHING